MKNLYQRIQETYPENDPILIAIETITEEKEINKFIKDCIKYYQKSNISEVKYHPKEFVNSYILFKIDSKENENAYKWIKGLEYITNKKSIIYKLKNIYHKYSKKNKI